MLTDFSVSIVAVWLVGRAATGFGGVGGRLLELPPVMSLGTISYGVYVYHGFMPYLAGYVAGPLMAPVGPDWLWRFLVLSTATIAIASVSWRVLERPILRLKRHFV